MEIVKNINYHGKVNFICSDPYKFGARHLFRCINLSVYLTDLGFSCEFFLEKSVKNGFINFLKSKYKLKVNFNLNKLFFSEWLVIDHHRWLDLKIINKSNIIPKTIYFDDYCDSDNKSDIILNSSLCISNKYYEISDKQTLISGANAVIIDKIFLKIRKLNIKNTFNFPPKNILLNLGFQPSMISVKLWINALFDFFKDVKIEVNVGPTFINENLCLIDTKKYKDKLRILPFVENSEDFYRKFDLVVGNCGINSVERAVAGIPSINVLVGEKQKNNYNFLKKNKALVFKHENNTNEISISTFLKGINFDELKFIVAHLYTLYDGFAAKRCVLAMAGKKNLVNEKLWLRNVLIKDATILYKWRLEENTVSASRNPPPENFKVHLSWLNKKLDDRLLIFAIIMIGIVPVGTIRLEEVNFSKRGYEVFVNISQKYQNKGIATSALSLLKNITPNLDVYANILTGNKNSIKLFLNSNFIKFKANWFKRG